MKLLKSFMKEKKEKRNRKGLFSNFDLTWLTADAGKERKFLFENIALMILGGLNITDVLISIKEEVKSTKIKNLIQKMDDDIHNGFPIWKAFENSGLISDHLLSVIRIGEDSGRLSENIQIVVEQKARDDEFKQKLRSASMYPAFVLILMLVIALGVGIFILPRLSGIYANLQVELPFITVIMINFGNFMGQYGVIVGPAVLIVLGLLIYFIFIFKRTKFIGQNILLKTPVIKRLIQEIEISRLGYLLGTLLNAGIPLPEALGLIRDSTTYGVYRRMYAGWLENLEKGYTLRESFDLVPGTNKFLPLYPKQAIITGEKTATLGDALVRIGEIYIKKNENSTKDLSVMLEPILLMLVWTGVAFIAFAVILPIYSLVGDITNITQSQGNTPVEQAERIESDASNSFDEAVSSSTTEVVTGEVIVINKDLVEIYSEPDGVLVGEVERGNIYTFTNRIESWYEIELDDGSLVWINEEFTQEI